jgi:hypothetical protein
MANFTVVSDVTNRAHVEVMAVSTTVSTTLEQMAAQSEINTSHGSVTELRQCSKNRTGSSKRIANA